MSLEAAADYLKLFILQPPHIRLRRNTVKKYKIINIITFILCAVILLSSCGIRDGLAVLGFDTHDYDGEEVIKTYAATSSMSAELCEKIRVLTVNGVDIPEFSSTKEATDKCRDAVLNYMLNTNYLKYAGNFENLEEAEKAYPQMRFSVIIPAREFENIIYMYFGGKEKVQNKSGNLFEYLPKIDAYVTAVQPEQSELVFETSEVEETENSFRLSFICSRGDEKSDKYYALFIKREDGNHYFKYVKKIN